MLKWVSSFEHFLNAKDELESWEQIKEIKDRWTVRPLPYMHFIRSSNLTADSEAEL